MYTCTLDCVTVKRSSVFQSIWVYTQHNYIIYNTFIVILHGVSPSCIGEKWPPDFLQNVEHVDYHCYNEMYIIVYASSNNMRYQAAYKLAISDIENYKKLHSLP